MFGRAPACPIQLHAGILGQGPRFPLQPPAYVHRMGQVIKGAKSAEWGEIYLQRDLEMFTRDLITAGADPVKVRREARALECAIRAEVWRAILLPERDDAST